MEGEGNEVRYTRASADIIAKTQYTIEAQLPLKHIEKKYTGIVKTKYSFRMIDKKINLYNPGIELKVYDYVVNSKQLQITSKFPLPFYWIREEYIEYMPKTKIISDEIAQDTLVVMLHDLLNQKIHQNGKVIKQEVRFVKKDDIMFARLQAIVKEELGKESGVPIGDERNEADGKE